MYQLISLTCLLLALLSTFNASLIPLQTSVRSEECPVVFDQQPPVRFARRAMGKPERHSSRIINGDPSSTDLSTYVVGISTSFQAKYCTGVLIGPRLAVTTASCISGKFWRNFSDLHVYPGGQYAFEGDPIRVAKYVPNENYEPRFLYGNDPDNFAFLELVDSVPPPARPMKVSVNLNLPRLNTWVRTAGYGLLDREISQSGDEARLHQIDLPVFDPVKCEEIWLNLPTMSTDGQNFNTKRQVCAGYEDRLCSGCGGDGGGPLIQYDSDGDPVLLGVFAAGYECGDIYNAPNVFSKTPPYEPELSKYKAEGNLFKTEITVVEIPVTTSPPEPTVEVGTTPIPSGTSTDGTATPIGLIAGIIVAVVLAICIIGCCLWFFFVRGNGNDSSTTNKGTVNSNNSTPSDATTMQVVRPHQAQWQGQTDSIQSESGVQAGTNVEVGGVTIIEEGTVTIGPDGTPTEASIQRTELNFGRVSFSEKGATLPVGERRLIA